MESFFGLIYPIQSSQNLDIFNAMRGLGGVVYLMVEAPIKKHQETFIKDNLRMVLNMGKGRKIFKMGMYIKDSM